MDTAGELKELTDRLEINFIYKSFLIKPIEHREKVSVVWGWKKVAYFR